MKVGFTGIERNIYGLKKRKNISFKATNSITEDKKIKPEEKNSEEAAKRKKMIIAGTLTAVAVPATIVALAMLGAKGKKKVNTSSIAKIEKEITQSDLLKETQEIAKILKVYNKTKQISFNDAANLTKALTAYNKTLKKVFGPQITKNILPNIDKITGILSKYLNEEKNKASKQSFTTATAGFKEAITNLELNIKVLSNILSKNNDIASVTRMLEVMSRRTRRPQREERATADGKQAIMLNGSSQVRSNVIPKTKLDNITDLSSKQFQDVRYAQDENGKPYIIFNKTSDIGAANKQLSGFRVQGMGDKRFVAISLDGLKLPDFTKLIINEALKEQMIANDISQQAKTFTQSLLEHSSQLDVIGLIQNANIADDNHLIEDYIDKHIEIISDEQAPQQNINAMKELVTNSNTLTLLASSKSIFEERISKCIEYVEGYMIGKSETETEVEVESNPYTIFQNLASQIKETYSTTHTSLVDKCKNFICLTDLLYSQPKDLMANYAKLIETNKEKIHGLNENEQLFIYKDGSTEIGTAPENQFNLRYQISVSNNTQEIVVKKYMDPEIKYIHNEATDGGKLQFKSLYKDKLNDLKDAYDIQESLESNIGLDKPILYSLMDMTRILMKKYEEAKIEADQKKAEAQDVDKRNSLPQTLYGDNTLGTVDIASDLGAMLSMLQDINSKFKTFLDNKIPVKTKKESINEILLQYEKNKTPLYLKSIYDNNSFATLINSNSPIVEGDDKESYIMAQFAVNKLGIDKKDVFKTLYDINGNKLDRQVRIGSYETDESGSITSTTFYLDDGTIYTFVSDGQNGYQINERQANNNTFSDDKYHFTSNNNSINTKGNISQNKAVESLLFSTISRAQKKKYLELKIKGTIDGNPLWADEVENIINTMYFCNLLENRLPSDSANEESNQTARQIYQNYIERQEPGILYIDNAGKVSGIPKNSVYQLTLG